jgi:hypothetical protein
MGFDILHEEHTDAEPMEVDVPTATQVEAPPTTLDVPIVTPKLSNACKIALSISPYILQEIFKVPIIQNCRSGEIVQIPSQLLDFATKPQYCPHCCEPLGNMGSHHGQKHINFIYQCHGCRCFFKTVNPRQKATIHFNSKLGRGFDAEAVTIVASCILAGSTYTTYYNQNSGESKQVHCRQKRQLLTIVSLFQKLLFTGYKNIY